MASLHFVLPSQSVAQRHSHEPAFSPAPCSSPCAKFEQPAFLESMCQYRVYAVAGNKPLVKRFGALRCSEQLPEAQQTCFSKPAKGRNPGSRSDNYGFSVLHSLQLQTVRSARNVTSRARLGGDGDPDVGIYEESVAEDYYALLGLTPDATPDEIKKAYYSCMKSCHPDLSGNSPSVNEFCVFVNEVYEVLSDPEQRMIYDEINGYTITATNPFKDKYTEPEYAFVDEFTCIGCKNCAHTAPKTFEMEELYGRARVASQSGNPVLIERAIQTCPVDCIYWVTAAQLTLLEDEMRMVERVNVGMMLSGMGYQSPDVFGQASWKWEKRQSRAIERARVRMMKQSGKNGSDAWWNFHWGSGADEKSSRDNADKYARERAAKTAAAARRWREYSRQGVYRRPIGNLPARGESDAEEEAEKEAAAGPK